MTPNGRDNAQFSVGHMTDFNLVVFRWKVLVGLGGHPTVENCFPIRRPGSLLAKQRYPDILSLGRRLGMAPNQCKP